MCRSVFAKQWHAGGELTFAPIDRFFLSLLDMWFLRGGVGVEMRDGREGGRGQGGGGKDGWKERRTRVKEQGKRKEKEKREKKIERTIL